MILVYVLLGLVGLFVLYRLVQWFEMAAKLEREGRDIRIEAERISMIRWVEATERG